MTEVNGISYLQGLKREYAQKNIFLSPPCQSRPFALVQGPWYHTSNNSSREGLANSVQYRGLATVQILVRLSDMYICIELCAAHKLSSLNTVHNAAVATLDAVHLTKFS